MNDDAMSTTQESMRRMAPYDPTHYINPWLSLINFNARVLAQAEDPSIPLLERLKFLCIFSTNMDEFFEVQVAGVRQRAALGAPDTGPDGIHPADVLKAVSERAHELVQNQYTILNQELIPALANENIRFLRRQEWNAAQRAWVRNYFQRELLPILSPLALDPAHPFPSILNKSLNFIVSIQCSDAFGRAIEFAVVQAPRALPRLVRLPPDIAGGPCDFVFLSSIIHAHVDELFPGMQTQGCYQFRVTRNSELFVDEEEVDDLLRAVQGELPSRRYSDAVRLEVADHCPTELAGYLLEEFGLDEGALYQENGPVNINRLMTVYEVDRPDLKYPPFTPYVPAGLTRVGNMFAEIRARDQLLHHPYDSFLPVMEFLRQAAADPDVLAIKQTLYRTGPNSAVVDALVDAARAGKEVTVVVEVRARFDEADNIDLATRLQRAGAHVVYGIVGYKAHAKLLLVVRRTADGLRHYAHLGTGNYHPRTARLYEDYGLFTCDEALCRDVHNVFLQLTSLGKVAPGQKLLQSPFALHQAIIAKIEREITHANEGRPAGIKAKLNSLVEPQVIQALYAASQAGVSVDLVVRGMCCLRPGLPGVSENIRVRSIVGRFLEHSRVYYFENIGDAELYCASADWMERNFFHRVEAAFPITEPVLRQRILDELALYLQDNVQAWELQADGSYRRLAPDGEDPVSVQQILMQRALEAGTFTPNYDGGN